MSSKLRNIVAIMALAFVTTLVGAQTLSEIAAQQRARTMRVLQPEVIVAPPVISAASVVKKKTFKLLSTFQNNLDYVALINDQGSLRSVTVDDMINSYSIVSIDSKTLTLQGNCVKYKCKTFDVKIGEGL